MIDNFLQSGARLFKSAVPTHDWITFTDKLPYGRAGVRLRGHDETAETLGAGSKLHEIAASQLGEHAKPVRAILFDKTEANNWSLGWHQDRTIAVKEQHEADGFGPWTTKQNILHVEPPFEIIQAMVTIRLHLDDVDTDNAPLRIAPGSHLLGKIAAAEYGTVIRRCGEFTCTARAGDVWLYSTPILHASCKAKSVHRRRVIQVDYSAHELPPPLQWTGVSAVL